MPNANADYLVDVIEETHAEKTPEGYLVYLFDWSHRMGLVSFASAGRLHFRGFRYHSERLLGNIFVFFSV